MAPRGKSKTRGRKKSITKKTKPKTPKKTKAKAKKVADPVEELEITDLLGKAKVSLLQELLQGNGEKIAKSSNKKKCVDKIIDLAFKTGNKDFLDTIDKELMKKIVEDLGEQVSNNKSALLKIVKSKMSKVASPFDFFGTMNKKTLESVTNHFGFELGKSAKKEELVGALEDEILINGLTKIIDNMKKDFVDDFASEVKVAKTKSKKHVINRILSVSFPHLKDVVIESTRGKKKEKKEKVVLKPEDKPDIKDGVSFEELYDAYYAKELTDWCRDQKIKISGTKKAVIKRIIRFLGGDIEGTRPLAPGEKRGKKRKNKSTDTGSAPKKAKTTKSKKKKAPVNTTQRKSSRNK